MREASMKFLRSHNVDYWAPTLPRLDDCAPRIGSVAAPSCCCCCNVIVRVVSFELLYGSATLINSPEAGLNHHIHDINIVRKTRSRAPVTGSQSVTLLGH